MDYSTVHSFCFALSLLAWWSMTWSASSFHLTPGLLIRVRRGKHGGFCRKPDVYCIEAGSTNLGVKLKKSWWICGDTHADRQQGCAAMRSQNPTFGRFELFRSVCSASFGTGTLKREDTVQQRFSIEHNHLINYKELPSPERIGV